MKAIILILACFLIGCSQPNHSRELTKRSEGYIAFSIGGIRDSIPDYVVSGDPGYITTSASFHRKSFVLDLSGNGFGLNEAASLDLNFAGCSDTGYYPLIVNDASGSHRGIYFSAVSTPPGSIHVTELDTLKRLVSGSFYFVGRNPRDSSLVKVDSGVFYRLPMDLID